MLVLLCSCVAAVFRRIKICILHYITLCVGLRVANVKRVTFVKHKMSLNLEMPQTTKLHVYNSRIAIPDVHSAFSADQPVLNCPTATRLNCRRPIRRHPLLVRYTNRPLRHRSTHTKRPIIVHSYNTVASRGRQVSDGLHLRTITYYY